MRTVSHCLSFAILVSLHMAVISEINSLRVIQRLPSLNFIATHVQYILGIFIVLAAVQPESITVIEL